MVIIGGIGSIEGPIITAVVFYLLQDQLQSLDAWYLVILGVVAVAMTLLVPQGLWGVIARGGRWQLFPVGYRLMGRHQNMIRNRPPVKM